MRPGANELRASASASPAPAARDWEDRLVLDDYPTSGPIFSGPQLHPWFCATALFGLGEATDDACDAPTQVQYEYKSTGGSFKALTGLDQVPADVASTTTSDGRTVPYIVRLETGTLDRGIYQIGILDNPFEPGSPGTRGWNRRLVAGAPATDGILQRQLRAVSPGAYHGGLTRDQFERLRRIFPQGVCDYGKPSQNASRFLGTWLSFGG